MYTLSASETYFSNKYHLFCNKIDYLNFSYDRDLTFLCDRVLSLYENDFQEHLNNIIQKNKGIYNLKELNIMVINKNIHALNNFPYSISNILEHGIYLFQKNNYYNSFISIPIFDYILNFLCSEVLYLSHSVFDSLKNGTIEETFKSTPTILNKIKETNKYNLNKIFEFLFTTNYIECDLRSMYSHYMFNNSDHIKSLSHIYYLFIINWILIPNIKGIIYEKK